MLGKVLDTMGLPFVVIYALMFLGLIYFTFVSIPRTLKAKNWPKAYGKITSSELYEGNRVTKSGGVTTVYSAKIEYEYEVNGAKYASKKIKWIDHNSNNKTFHESVVNKYFIGSAVDVFYNPKKPSVGLLEPGLGVGNLIGFVFFVIGLGSMSAVVITKI